MKLEHFIPFALEGKLALNKLLHFKSPKHDLLWLSGVANFHPFWKIEINAHKNLVITNNSSPSSGPVHAFSVWPEHHRAVSYQLQRFNLQGRRLTQTKKTLKERLVDDFPPREEESETLPEVSLFKPVLLHFTVVVITTKMTPCHTNTQNQTNNIKRKRRHSSSTFSTATSAPIMLSSWT